MNIIYIGSSGPFSLYPLQRLIDSAYNVAAVAIDDDTSSTIPVINNSNDSIAALAFAHNIPLLKLKSDFSLGLSLIQDLQPDIILVSCYARKLPDSILSLARIGAFNIHPSLLPAYRGPVPLFWQFRNGAEHFGVTIHRLTSEFDRGNIVSHKKISIADGSRLHEAIDVLAYNAGHLLIKTLAQIELDEYSEFVQNEETASYFRYPTIKDYSVSTDWTAKRIFNFICAYSGDGIVFPLEISGARYHLTTAHSYQLQPYAGMQNKSLLIQGDDIIFSCQDGFIRCQFEIS